MLWLNILLPRQDDTCTSDEDCLGKSYDVAEWKKATRLQDGLTGWPQLKSNAAAAAFRRRGRVVMAGHGSVKSALVSRALATALATT